MSIEFDIQFIWIPHDLGGHRAEPYVGMRTTIRWQRYLQEHLECARDAECTQLSFDTTTQRGSATLRMVSEDPLPATRVQEGTLIEVLDGYRVIAVGRIGSGQSIT